MESRVFAGKFRAVRELSEESAGRTWLAADPGGDEVVVKVVHPSDAAAAAAVEHDVSLISGIRNPALPTIYEWGHDGGDFFVVREWVPGADLKTELGQQERFAPLTVAHYGAAASAALAEIHQRGLLHGNVKTANLIRTPEDTVKLVGNSLGPNVPVPFPANVLPSSAHYLAPEQVEGGVVTPATDVYAMGVVLYELLTGHAPFDGPTAASVADQQAHKPPAPVREVEPEIPPALEAVVMRALEKSPEARYANGEELRAALQQVIQPAPVAGAPTGAPAAKRRGAGVWLWIALGVLLLVLAGAAAWLLGAFGGSHEAIVPAVVGLSQSEASAKITAVGLQVGSVAYAGGPVAGIVDGSVSSQAPAQGTRVDPATKVDLVLAGIEAAVVPNVVGVTEAQAVITLQNAGLVAGAITNVATTTVTPTTVIVQTPTAGVRVNKGSSVQLQIAQTPTTVAVPDVTNRTRADATAVLQNAGFAVTVVRRASTTVASGRVVDQSPTGGVAAQPGSTVTIIVSNGPAQTTVPDVVGETQANAVNALTAAGFKTQITFQTGGGTVGDVVDQSPNAGTKATTGSTVTITVVQ
jgi:eukaryotic-like serine/threonine-protein kinase